MTDKSIYTSQLPLNFEYEHVYVLPIPEKVTFEVPTTEFT